MKGHVLHRVRAHLKVPGCSLVWNALLTKKLPMFLSRLNEINGGCEKILPVSGSFWSNLKFFRMMDFTAWLWGWNVRVNGILLLFSFWDVCSADCRSICWAFISLGDHPMISPSILGKSNVSETCTTSGSIFARSRSFLPLFKILPCYEVFWELNLKLPFLLECCAEILLSLKISSFFRPQCSNWDHCLSELARRGTFERWKVSNVLWPVNSNWHLNKAYRFIFLKVLLKPLLSDSP